MSAGRICIRTVDTALPTEPVQTVARRMSARNVGMLVVIDSHNKPTGIITDRDLVIGVIAEGKSAFQTRVDEVMSYHPRTVSENATLEESLTAMRSGPYRRLPVVDDQGCLVGVLAIDDLITLLADEFSQIRRVLEKESPTAMGQL